jgi:hypothetical protein
MTVAEGAALAHPAFSDICSTSKTPPWERYFFSSGIVSPEDGYPQDISEQPLGKIKDCLKTTIPLAEYSLPSLEILPQSIIL